MIPLHCLWAKSNNRTRGRFECDVTWLCFCFDFIRSHARCACCSIACWREGGKVFKNWTSKVKGGRGGGCRNALDVMDRGIGGLEN